MENYKDYLIPKTVEEVKELFKPEPNPMAIYIHPASVLLRAVEGSELPKIELMPIGNPNDSRFEDLNLIGNRDGDAVMLAVVRNECKRVIDISYIKDEYIRKNMKTGKDFDDIYREADKIIPDELRNTCIDTTILD